MPEQALGALWIKRGPSGQYMSGEILIDGVKTNIVCFINEHKTKDNHPDWRILRQKPKEDYIMKPIEEERNQAELNDIPIREYPEPEADLNDIPF